MAAPIRIFRLATKVMRIPSRHSLGRTKMNDFVVKIFPIVYHERCISQSQILYTKESFSELDMKKRMQSLTDKFSEAREMLEDARESMGTVYFSEDMEEAQTAVNETLDEYKNFLEEVSDEQRQEVISTIGLRMEELKAQKAAIEETLKD